ncbi:MULTISPECIES: creatininase family protein [unclassified Microbacterium]|uniref:creatininase family protein n=1 Tax=unclassified Microbacterium TaxID=2609290 RepID=UPI000CFBB871|nr:MULTISPECIES: creatininase family protein [unclassified Microbacterium]PQZ60238.1 creatinase [Microbacterium sp. MYb43]PQZ76889.1 creatinase [Microbacterium sp. MYb40]PRB23281.1 creatinase [Microbacterium sp. MYb54]PRB28185.1 creatinase [Microbacterium sp. MYb50]PRB66236.1 creatinase [Microbacterium sp. MYb24]
MSIPTVAADRLSPQQIEERLAAASVVYIPLGSLEFHGPHLPIGLDALTAYGLCLRAAAAGGGIVLPVVHHAVGGEHSRYPWTIMSDSPVAIETLLTETLTRLSDFGVQRAVLLSGHFADEQRDLITRVADRWNATDAPLRAVARTLGQAPEPPVAPDHAGRFESLVLYALAPELVNVEALPDPEVFPVPVDEDPFGQDRHRADHPLHGVFGPDPRRLDVDAAAGLRDHLVSWIAGLATVD